MKAIFPTLAAVLLLATAAAGGTISISTWTSFTGENLAIGTANRGDEAAQQVMLTLNLAGWERAGRLIPSLSPGGEVIEEFSLAGVLPELPGLYPARVLVSYTDAAGYAFSALSVLLLPRGEARASVLHLHLFPLDCAGEGELECRVVNRGGRPLAAEIALELAPEFQVADARRRLELQPGEDRKLFFRVRNLAATPGSSYPVFLVAEHGDGARHYAALAQNLVTVRPGGARARNWFIAAAAVVILGAAAAVFLPRRRLRGRA
jgi:hypothetical protein